MSRVDSSNCEDRALLSFAYCMVGKFGVIMCMSRVDSSNCEDSVFLFFAQRLHIGKFISFPGCCKAAGVHRLCREKPVAGSLCRVVLVNVKVLLNKSNWWTLSMYTSSSVE